MARIADSKTPVVVKNPTRQKIIVAQGRAFGSPEVPYKVLHTEIVAEVKAAKERIKELEVEYQGTDALSINYFSL